MCAPSAHSWISFLPRAMNSRLGPMFQLYSASSVYSGPRLLTQLPSSSAFLLAASQRFIISSSSLRANCGMENPLSANSEDPRHVLLHPCDELGGRLAHPSIHPGAQVHLVRGNHQARQQLRLLADQLALGDGGVEHRHRQLQSFA